VTTSATPRWMSTVLVLAGIYNIAWGAWVILFPAVSFSYSGMEQAEKPLHYPQLWQCIGMIVGVYGVAYILAARDPVRHWPVVLVGFLGKFFGPVGLLFGVLTGQTPPQGLLTIIPNDLIWWAPFLLTLRHASRAHRLQP
jgi:small multidrug resistance pump